MKNFIIASCVMQVLQLSLNEEDSPSSLSHMLTLLKNNREGSGYVYSDIKSFKQAIFVTALIGNDKELQLNSTLRTGTTVAIFNVFLKLFC